MNPFLRPPVRQSALALLLAALVLPLAPSLGAHPSEPTAPAADWLAYPTGDVPLGPTQSDASDVTFTLTSIESDFDTEDYKEDDRFSTRNPTDVENQTTNWANALGHRISFFVEIEGSDGASLACSDRFVAETYIDTHSGDGADARLWGWTNGPFETEPPAGVGDVCPSGLPGERVYNLTFDLDGTPPTVTGARYPALAPGAYAATFELYHAVTPTPTNPSGKGPLAGTYEIPFSIATPRLTLDQPTFRFPERALRLFSDVGASYEAPDSFEMPTRPLALDENLTLTAEFRGAPVGAVFERIDHFATRTGAGAEAPTDPPRLPEPAPPADPVGDKLQNVDDRGTVRVYRSVPTLTNDTVPSSRTIIMQLRGADFPSVETPTTSYVPLRAIAMHLPASLESPVTGVARFVLPVSDQVFPVRSIDIDQGVAGVTGQTTITYQDSTQEAGGTSGANAGDLFAINEFAPDSVIARTQLQREAGTRWVSGDLDHTAFPDDPGVSRYLALAMLYGPGDEFLGMTAMRRGIDIQVGSLRMVEGTTDMLPLTVTNLAEDFDATPGEADFAIVVHIRSNPGFPDGSAYNHTTRSLAEGQSVTIEVPVPGDTPGNFNIRFTATNGELNAEKDSTVQVISKERAREENRKWYEIPGPPVTLIVVALLGLVLVARRRP